MITDLLFTSLGGAAIPSRLPASFWHPPLFIQFHARVCFGSIGQYSVPPHPTEPDASRMTKADMRLIERWDDHLRECRSPIRNDPVKTGSGPAQCRAIQRQVLPSLHSHTGSVRDPRPLYIFNPRTFSQTIIHSPNCAAPLPALSDSRAGVIGDVPHQKGDVNSKSRIVSGKCASRSQAPLWRYGSGGT